MPYIKSRFRRRIHRWTCNHEWQCMGWNYMRHGTIWFCSRCGKEENWTKGQPRNSRKIHL